MLIRVVYEPEKKWPIEARLSYPGDPKEVDESYKLKKNNVYVARN
jgi:hypothetical protein